MGQQSQTTAAKQALRLSILEAATSFAPHELRDLADQLHEMARGMRDSRKERSFVANSDEDAVTWL